MDYTLKHKIANILLFCICFECFAFENKHISKPLKHLELNIGETNRIKISENSEVYINNKGIIAANYLNDGNWQIIGLKVGTSLIQTEQQSWLVHVNKKSTKTYADAIPKWICKNGLKCDETEQIISGFCSDPFLFIKAKTWCMNKKDCLFAGLLNKEAILDLQVFYSDKLKTNYEFDVHPNGIIEFKIPCEDHTAVPKKETIQKISKQAKLTHQEDYLQISCKKPKLKNFKLKGKVVLLNKMETDITHFDTNSYLQLKEFPFTKADKLAKTIELLISEKKAQIIGQPSLSLIEGRTAKLKSGGEFQVPIKTTAGTHGHSWKSFGLSMSTTLSTLKQSLKAKIDFSLSTIDSKVSKQLVTSSISTELTLQKGQEVVVGSVEIKSHQTTKNENSILGNIPLISPFFQNTEAEDSYSKMILLIQID